MQTLTYIMCGHPLLKLDYSPEEPGKIFFCHCLCNNGIAGHTALLYFSTSMGSLSSSTVHTRETASETTIGAEREVELPICLNSLLSMEK